MARFTGKCLCGRIAYSVDGPTGNLVHCHCSRCRAWHGSPFRSRVVVRTGDFSWTEGETNLSYYEETPNVTRTFCRVCGSNLISIYPKRPDILGVPVGGIQGNLGQPEAFHIFVDSGVNWHRITDNLDQYAELPDDAGSIHRVYP